MYFDFLHDKKCGIFFKINFNDCFLFSLRYFDQKLVPFIKNKACINTEIV